MSDSMVVGIDLGTTFSAMAYIDRHGKPQIIANAEGKRTTPSVVFFDEDGSVIVGESARNMAIVEPGRTVQFIKRHMGDSSYSLYMDGGEWYPEGISARILMKLLDDARAALNSQVPQAVISVPAYFKDSQREATRTAGQLAGLDEVTIINEPTAAALAYGLGKGGARQNLLVYDFGGGTFDVTVLRVDGNEFRVLATDGNSHLGGVDIDNRLVDYLAEQYMAQHGTDLRRDPHSLHALREKAEQAKIALSSRQSVTVTLGEGGTPMRVDLGLEQLGDLTRDLLAETADCMEQARAAARLDWSEIDRVLLVGGSSRMRCVHELIRQVTGKEPSLDINPDECVARGAAIRGTILAIQETEGAVRPGEGELEVTDIVIRDVTPHSLGVKAMSADGRPVNSIIIPRFTEVPCDRRRTYATRVDKQQSIEVEVLQGEAEDPFSPELELIGRLEMRDLPAKPAGQVIVTVTLRYNSEGVVEVIAEELTGGRVVREQLLRKVGELAPDVLASIKRQLEEEKGTDGADEQSNAVQDEFFEQPVESLERTNNGE